ncbi:hypothetical protein ACWCQ0_50805, partial [Streptomyces massasporeus]
MSVAATALARVAFGSGTPSFVTRPVPGSYIHSAGAFPGTPPTAYTVPSGATASSRMSLSSVRPTPTAGLSGVVRSQRKRFGPPSSALARTPAYRYLPDGSTARAWTEWPVPRSVRATTL